MPVALDGPRRARPRQGQAGEDQLPLRGHQHQLQRQPGDQVRIPLQGQPGDQVRVPVQRQPGGQIPVERQAGGQMPAEGRPLAGVEVLS